MNRAYARSVFAWALAVGLAACSGNGEDSLSLPSAPSSSLPIGSDVVLAPGETVIVNPHNLRVTFVAVTAESRCPLSVQCVQAGSARVALQATSSAGTRDIPLETTKVDTASVERYVVRLVGVAPVPATPGLIPASAYRVTLRITAK